MHVWQKGTRHHLISLKRRQKLFHPGKSDVDYVNRRLSTSITTDKAHLAEACQNGKMLRDQITNDSGSSVSTMLLDSRNARCNPGVLSLQKIERAVKLVILACGKVAVANVVLAEWNHRHDNESLCRAHSDA